MLLNWIEVFRKYIVYKPLTMTCSGSLIASAAAERYNSRRIIVTMSKRSPLSYKQSTERSRRGMRGEAFVESILSEHALVHRITGHRDLGLDHICEWIAGERPSGTLFGIQVKTLSARSVALTSKGIDSLNGLEAFNIQRGEPRPDQRTLAYWRDLGLPTFLFLVVESASTPHLTCYYKRYTPTLTGATDPDGKGTCFYRAEKDARLHAFAPNLGRQGGFARDLFFDTIRWQYHRGRFFCPDPSTFGLEQFGPNHIFLPLISAYWPEFVRVFEETRAIMRRLGYSNSRSTEGE